MRRIINNAKAFLLGFRDGWEQPEYLSTSRNVDHLYVEGGDPWDWQDRGINVGQRVRAPRRYQRFEEGKR
ncbi:hypothetical protein JRC04_05015 [Mycolicibacterium sp. S2-37]|uniref:hypothetical protein n=1 Tax=Mycolicibacterium sp. S2-37 TaxID=2810297 RepID=UPI001A93FD6F|nr:hypothetical protein [Mycolicibacterium sp. S2-37]MBO0676818.1 hypothetical protein [Mycolicibacterium sp. S2-37]